MGLSFHLRETMKVLRIGPMHLKFNSHVDDPARNLRKLNYFLHASSLIIGKHRHRFDVAQDTTNRRLKSNG
jgi:hypothetical protein